jgi:hypothetical protein
MLPLSLFAEFSLQPLGDTRPDCVARVSDLACSLRRTLDFGPVFTGLKKMKGLAPRTRTHAHARSCMRTRACIHPSPDTHRTFVAHNRHLAVRAFEFSAKQRLEVGFSPLVALARHPWAVAHWPVTQVGWRCGSVWRGACTQSQLSLL